MAQLGCRVVRVQRGSVRVQRRKGNKKIQRTIFVVLIWKYRYYNSVLQIIIVDIWEWGLASSFREYLNWKLIAVPTMHCVSSVLGVDSAGVTETNSCSNPCPKAAAKDTWAVPLGSCLVPIISMIYFNGFFFFTKLTKTLSLQSGTMDLATGLCVSCRISAKTIIVHICCKLHE